MGNSNGAMTGFFASQRRFCRGSGKTMTKRTRRTQSAGFKAKVALAVINGGKVRA